MIEKTDGALVLVGHGSTENEDSSAPTWHNVLALREMGVFAEVHACFWKEEPSMREVLLGVEADDVYIVPNFISEGYFTMDVIPRELQLSGAVTRRNGKTLKYCDPVGLHLSMTDLLKARAEETAPDVDPAQTTLLLVGHGTRLNDRSRVAVEAQVEKFRGETRYAEVIDTYMEEEPLITNWRDIASRKNVLVVPFFISDGLHSYQDIPVMLGIEKEPTEAASRREVFRHNPHEMDGRKLYYSAAIGSHPEMVKVILDQVAQFDQNHPEMATPAGVGA